MDVDVAAVWSLQVPEGPGTHDIPSPPGIQHAIADGRPIGWLVPPPKPPRQPRRQRSREEMLQEQVKRTERELARLRRELKEVTSAPAQSSVDNASPLARLGSHDDVTLESWLAEMIDWGRYWRVYEDDE